MDVNGIGRRRVQAEAPPRTAPPESAVLARRRRFR
jgi:hypothetical protein